MDSSNGQHQEMSTQSLETMLVCSKTQQEKKPRPQQDQALKCPRCDSTNTKFCYYNNYSLTQPRYFCKSCRRYWTKGGTLRNVPVGGGCRKNKRPSSKRSQDQQQPLSSTHLPSLTYHDCDVSILGNPNNTHCDIPIFGNSFGFLDNPNGFNANMYYGLGNGGMAEEMVLPYGDMSGGGATTTAAVTVTTMKEEFCSSNGREGDGRVLWGFPWQIGGDGMMGDVESVRESFNGLAPWHGLLNSPLM